MNKATEEHRFTPYPRGNTNPTCARCGRPKDHRLHTKCGECNEAIVSNNDQILMADPNSGLLFHYKCWRGVRYPK
jgi:hypothetical protein